MNIKIKSKSVKLCVCVFARARKPNIVGWFSNHFKYNYVEALQLTFLNISRPARLDVLCRLPVTRQELVHMHDRSPEDNQKSWESCVCPFFLLPFAILCVCVCMHVCVHACWEGAYIIESPSCNHIVWHVLLQWNSRQCHSCLDSPQLSNGNRLSSLTAHPHVWQPFNAFSLHFIA